MEKCRIYDIMMVRAMDDTLLEVDVAGLDGHEKSQAHAVEPEG